MKRVDNNHLSVAIYVIIVPFIYYLNPLFHQEAIISITGIFIFFCLALTFILSLFPSNKTNIKISFTTIDLAVTGYLMYAFMNALFVSKGNLDYFIGFKWIVLFGAYMLVSLLPNKRMVLYGIVISGSLQSLLAVGQGMELLNSEHYLFNITGSFVNPAHLGGFVCICLTITLCLLHKDRQNKNKNKKRLTMLSIAIFAQFLGLGLSDSRAAVVGAIVGIMVTVIQFFPVILKKHKVIIPVLCISGLVTAGIFFYNYRKDSVDGRLLIWRVSAEMIADKPILGHGVGQYGNKYMLYQAAYFESYPESKYTMVADNVEHAFNEFIHVSVEQGILGLGLVIMIFILIFTAINKGPNRIVKSGVAAWIGFAHFSYPTDVFPLLFLLVILIGCIESPAVLGVGCRKLFKGIGVLLFGGIGFLFAAEINIISRVADVFLRMNVAPSEKYDFHFLDQQYCKLKYNPIFNTLYFRWYIERGGDIDLQKLVEIKPGCEGYCSVGKVFQERNMFGDAAKFYRTASFMIPSRIIPNYNLWELYRQTGEESKAVDAAKKIIGQPIKVENTFTIRIRRQVRRYLENRQ